MRRLSTIIKPSHDRWITLAFVVMAVLATVAAWQGVHHHDTGAWAAVSGGMVPMIAAISARIRRMRSANMADEAWVDGDDLLLKRAGLDVRLPLTDIADVDAGRWSDVVTLEMSRPCTLGGRVCFVAPPRRGRDIRAELKRRMAEVRRHA